MSQSPPGVVILAGPNGAGKSTVAPALLRDALAVTEFVDADVIARGLSAFNPESVSIAAGRVMLARLRELSDRRESFAFETTLASRSHARWLQDVRTSGYEIHILFLWCHRRSSLWAALLHGCRLADTTSQPALFTVGRVQVCGVSSAWTSRSRRITCSCWVPPPATCDADPSVPTPSPRLIHFRSIWPSDAALPGESIRYAQRFRPWNDHLVRARR